MIQVSKEIDPRDLSFAKRALLEVNHKPIKQSSSKSNDKAERYWAIIQLPNNKFCKYQFSKDIQYAIKHDGIKQARSYLINSLIVIPKTKFYQHENGQNYADMTVGRIVFILRLPQTHNTRWITRGQLIQPKTSPINENEYTRICNYLEHDYDEKSKARIQKAVKKLTHYRPITSAILLLLIFIAIIIMIYLEYKFQVYPIII